MVGDDLAQLPDGAVRAVRLSLKGHHVRFASWCPSGGSGAVLARSPDRHFRVADALRLGGTRLLPSSPGALLLRQVLTAGHDRSIYAAVFPGRGARVGQRICPAPA